MARVALLLVAAAVAATGAARPRWGRAGADAVGVLDVAVAVDVSQSMRTADVAPSRLERAITVVRRAVDLLPEARVALTVGAGESLTLVPLGADREALRAALSAPMPPAGMTPGSNLAVLLTAGAGQLAGGRGGRALLVATDGEEHEGAAAGVAAGLRREGISVVVLQCGSGQGGPVPVANAEGATTYLRDRRGALVHSRARREVLAALAGDGAAVVDAGAPGAAGRLAARLAAAARDAEEASRPERAAPFALVAALVASAAFLTWPWRRGAGLALAALVLAAPVGAEEPSEPGSWPHWLPGSWYPPAVRAGRQLERGDVEAARRSFRVALVSAPKVEAVALGAASAAAVGGDAAGLADLEGRCGRAPGEFVACYNAGVARLLLGDDTGAIAALRQAVVLRPADPGAWRNLEVALLRQRQRAAPPGGPARPAVTDMEAALFDSAAAAAMQPAALELTGRVAVVEAPW
jgi:Ca-activated chloride channel family protein